MIIKRAKIRNFLIHRDLDVALAPGFNVIRGANEGGKSSFMEALGYNWFGTRALAGTKDETLNDQETSPSAMSTETEFEINGKEYRCLRSFRGAELYHAGEKAPFVTGHTEVTQYIESLLGVPDRVPGDKIIFAPQNEIRGALDLGPTAATEFIEKLADFSEVDQNIIKRLEDRLPHGPTVALEDAVKSCEEEVSALNANPQIDTTIHDDDIKKIADQLPGLRKKHESDKAVVYSRLAAAEAFRRGIQEAGQKQATLRAKIGAYKNNLAELQELKKKEPEAAARAMEIEALMLEAVDYEVWASMPAAPEDYWGGPLEDFEAEKERVGSELAAANKKTVELDTEIRLLEKRKVESGNCPTCGKPFNDPAEAKATNKKLQEKIARLQESRRDAQTVFGESNEYRLILLHLDTLQQQVVNWLNKYPGYTDQNEGMVPWGLQWSKPVPRKIDTAPLEKEYEEIQSLLTKISKSGSVEEGQLKAAEEELISLQGAIERYTREEELAGQGLDELKASVAQQESALRDLESRLNQLKNKKTILEQQKIAAVEEEKKATAALKKAKKLLHDQLSNNVLIKQAKAARVQVSSKLWQKVLSSTSYYFSQLRGRPSTIVRTNKAFRVEGEKGRLSGSTLDILGLALRIVTSKVFSSSRIMGLDEPSAGCDAARTAAMVGALLASDFDQIIMVTHDDLVETGAAHIIEL